MTSLLINATQLDELRVAIVDKGVLSDLDIERASTKQTKSNIYKGVISSIEPSLGAVFINYGSERHGFLPFKEVSSEYFLTGKDGNEHVEINKALKIGQEVVVQIEKEERGNKGAALTTFISLAGSYLVLMPNNPRAGGISRRIDGDDRDDLKHVLNELELPEGMGVIIRTAGVNKEKEDLQWDLNVLLHYWEAIKQAAVAKSGPYLIHEEGDAITRAIRDYLRADMTEITIDDPRAYEQAKEYLTQVRPDFVGRLKLYADPVPLFSRYHVEQQIENTYQREIRLPSGGSMVIDHTEALVSIDVNSARSTRGKSIEETAFHTNLEAADELARQLRLRDIGGLIVIDFIDMTPVKNQREVENRLRKAVKMDRARIQIGRISRFGLLEMSRQRLRSSMNRRNQMTCPRCEGKGTIRGIESLAFSVIHMLEDLATQVSHQELQIQLPVDIATYLINEKRSSIIDIENQTHCKIMIIPNTYLQTPHYQLKQIKRTQDLNKIVTPLTETPSYDLMTTVAPEMPEVKKATAPSANEPAINAFLTTDKTTLKPKRPSLLKRLAKKLFTATLAPTETTEPQKPADTFEPRRNHHHSRKQGGHSRRRPHHHRHRNHRGGNREGGPNRPQHEHQDQRERDPRQQEPAKFSESGAEKNFDKTIPPSIPPVAKKTAEENRAVKNVVTPEKSFTPPLAPPTPLEPVVKPGWKKPQAVHAPALDTAKEGKKED